MTARVGTDVVTAKYLTAEQAGAYCNRAASVIKEAARRGDLAGYKASKGASWRFTTDDLDAWMERGRIQATAARGRLAR